MTVYLEIYVPSTSIKLLNAMKYIVQIFIIILLSGCTISADNYHFKLVEHDTKSYDDFHNIWCFDSIQNKHLTVCSSPYRNYSKSIGFIVPIIPQTDRSSRLAYDINRERVVEIQNRDASDSMLLTNVGEILQCVDKYGKSCKLENEIKIEPGGSVWLKIPKGEFHDITVTFKGATFVARIKEFVDSKWHAVSI